MRHGTAEGPYGRLTPEGKSRVKIAAAHLREDLKKTLNLPIIEYYREMNRAFSLPIYTSSAERAIHTGIILAEELEPIIRYPHLIVSTELNSEAHSIEKLVANINDPQAILVSHELDIERYTGERLYSAQWTRKEIA